MIVPNVMGFATWSPPLDAKGNSARGIMFFQELVKVYRWQPWKVLITMISIVGVNHVIPRACQGKHFRCWSSSLSLSFISGSTCLITLASANVTRKRVQLCKITRWDISFFWSISSKICQNLLFQSRSQKLVQVLIAASNGDRMALERSTLTLIVNIITIISPWNSECNRFQNVITSPLSLISGLILLILTWTQQIMMVGQWKPRSFFSHGKTLNPQEEQHSTLLLVRAT